MSEIVSAEVYHLVCKQVDELRDERDRLADVLREIATANNITSLSKHWDRDELVQYAKAALTPAGGGKDGHHGRR